MDFWKNNFLFAKALTTYGTTCYITNKQSFSAKQLADARCSANKMLKTYLYIPEQLEEKIILAVKTQNKSKAEVIRLAIENGIKVVNQQGIASALVLLKLADLGKHHHLRGPKDSSPRMDELLWGKDWSKDE